MATKKSGSDLLADRIRAVSGGAPKPLLPGGQGQPLVKTVRNKRGSERKDAFKQALLIMATGERVDVVVKNISATGARVDFYSGGTSIFGRAQLMAPSLGLKRWVRVAWKDQNSAGLEFETD